MEQLSINAYLCQTLNNVTSAYHLDKMTTDPSFKKIFPCVQEMLSDKVDGTANGWTDKQRIHNSVKTGSFFSANHLTVHCFCTVSKSNRIQFHRLGGYKK